MLHYYCTIIQLYILIIIEIIATFAILKTGVIEMRSFIPLPPKRPFFIANSKFPRL